MKIDTDKLREALRHVNVQVADRIDKIKDHDRAIKLFTNAETKEIKDNQLIDDLINLAQYISEQVKDEKVYNGIIS